MKRVRVVPPDERWPKAFLAAAEEVAAAMGPDLVELHHIGSTSIPGIHAKPIIDMLAVVRDIEALDERNPAMAAVGYRALGEYGIPGRRYFPRNASDGERTDQVQAFQIGSPDILRHLAFRDYLRSHPDVAVEYSRLKQVLAAAHADDIEACMDGKDGFIKEVEAEALTWIRPMEVRSTARLVLLDAAGRVLLFRYTDGTAREFWALPGGGLEPGETARQAARREVFEELGLEVDELPFLWSRHTAYVFADHPVSQSEAFFLVENPPVSFGRNLEEAHAREGILEMRWWDPRDLRTAAEGVFPLDLAERLSRVRDVSGT